MLYWLLGLLPVVAVAVTVWAYRRKSVQRDAARQERYAAILNSSREPAAAAQPRSAPSAKPLPGTATAARAPATASQPAAPPAPAPQAAVAPLPVDEQPLPYRARARALAQPHALLYYLLKSALPDHEIFVHASLDKLLEVGPEAAGAERDQRRRAISQLTVDCAVCTKTMGLAVAIDLVSPGTADASFKARCLEAAGVRYVRIDPVRLPRRDRVREVVLGQSE